MNYQTKSILAGFMGNLVEAYDVAICYYLAAALSRHLMGNTLGDPRVVFLLICLAYLIKPIGALTLGVFSDRFGRKRVLTASIIMTGLSTALIGLIPDYQQMGLLSVFLFLGLRIIQSIALGSEFLNSSSFLVESGNPNRRGFRGCWSSVGVKVGTILACVAAEITHQTTDPSAWRFPFLFAAFTMLIGFMIRYRMPESLGYVLYYANRPKPTSRTLYQLTIQLMKQQPFLFRYAFFSCVLSIASSFFFYLYIPMHVVHALHFSQAAVTLSTLCSLLLTALLIPVFGWYGDQHDRLTVMNFATTGLLVLAYPFMLAVNTGNPYLLLFMQLIIAMPCAAFYSVSSVLLTELFPIHIRCTALALIFSVAGSFAAGIPPVLADYLIRFTHNANSPCLIIMILAIVMLRHLHVLMHEYRSGRNEYAHARLLMANGKRGRG